jgi:L-threonylcarbamoyladenylate synthase
VKEIAACLQKGGIIVYPTETIYGLGADALNQKAVKRLFEIKTRAPDKPISVLVRDLDMLNRVVAVVPVIARSIMDNYWPGPVTIIFPASKRLPSILTGQTGNIGVRISPHPFVRRLFDFFDSPLTSTSANIAGRKNLKELKEILGTFGSQVDLVIDMSEYAGGKASTLIDVTQGRAKVLREGAVVVEGA